MVIILWCSVVCSCTNSLTSSFELRIIYVLGKSIYSLILLFRYFAILYLGAGLLLTTCPMGWFCLCVLIYAFSLGASGFIFDRYLCFLLSIMSAHPFITCWICFWQLGVGSFLTSSILLSSMNCSIFCSRFILSIITMVLLLSVLAVTYS